MPYAHAPGEGTFGSEWYAVSRGNQLEEVPFKEYEGVQGLGGVLGSPLLAPPLLLDARWWTRGSQRLPATHGQHAAVSGAGTDVLHYTCQTRFMLTGPPIPLLSCIARPRRAARLWTQHIPHTQLPPLPITPKRAQADCPGIHTQTVHRSSTGR